MTEEQERDFIDRFNRDRGNLVQMFLEAGIPADVIDRIVLPEKTHNQPQEFVEVTVMVNLVKRLTDKGVITGQGNADRTKRFEVHLSSPGDYEALMMLEKCVGRVMFLTGPVKFVKPPKRQEDEEEVND